MNTILMHDGAHLIILEGSDNERRANLLVKKREQYGDFPEDYEDSEVSFPIDKREAKQIIEGLTKFINNKKTSQL